MRSAELTLPITRKRSRAAGDCPKGATNMTALLMRFNEKSRKVREYTAGEEVVTSLTHAFGAAMAALGLVLLIAGSYTPYCLCVLDSSTGIPLLAAIWAVAALGSLAEA